MTHADERPPAIFLMGPTASGKTAVAARLAAQLPVEIISVDSAQVFRHMDIGTAKPAPDLLHAAPHHLIDILDPTERYSAARFVEDAGELIAEMHARRRVPLLVGGVRVGPLVARPVATALLAAVAPLTIAAPLIYLVGRHL